MASCDRDPMSELRELRGKIGLSQRECAALVHRPQSGKDRPDPATSPPDRKRGWPSKLDHPV